MSVDERLREMFASERPDVPVGPALAEVHRRVRRRRAVGRGAVAVAAAALVAVSWTTLGANRASTPPARPGPSEVADPTTPLDGAWEAGPLTDGDVRRILRAAGEDRWVTTVLDELPASPMRLRLQVESGSATLRVAGAGGRWTRFDEARVTVTGDELVLEPTGLTGANRYRWRRDGDRLELELVSSSESGQPDSASPAFQRALYTAAPWRLAE